VAQQILAAAALAIVACGSTAFAQTSGAQPPPAPASAPAGYPVTAFPSGDIYSVYVADPHRPSNSVAESFTVGGGIPETRSPLTQVATGGRFGMVRFGPAAPGGRAWQISVEAGFDALFDSQNKLDVVGWDGNYGLTVTTASSSPLAWKFGLTHVSSHIGDEYLMRTGRERLNYTREELNVGAAWRWSPQWRAYSEAGVAYFRGDDALKPWRLQGGVEWDSGLGPCGRRFACYAAADLSSMQERDWRRDVTAAIGIVVQSVGRTSRIFLEWHDGRPTANEFYTDTVKTLSLGLRMDL
jgi:opacity protein-like surface antigen